MAGLDLPARARAIALDVADAASWDATVAAFVADVGRLDILVNNAATHTQALVEEMSDDEWHRVLRTNADSVFFGCRAAVRSMRDGGRGGAIVNVVTGQFGVPYSSAYTASKFLVQGFSRCLALEVARYGIVSTRSRRASCREPASSAGITRRRISLG